MHCTGLRSELPRFPGPAPLYESFRWSGALSKTESIWNTGSVTSLIEDVFRQASCQGWLRVEGAGTATDVSGDEPVVAASVIKLLIALATETAFAEGGLDPAQTIRLSSLDRTPGPVGFSLFADDVTASSRDLVSAMLTISDNVAADALLHLVGIETCNELAAGLGLANTVIVSSLAVMIESIARDAGFADWSAMTAWSEAGPSAADHNAVDARIRTSVAFDPSRATRTTARDMCRFLRMVWNDEAGPREACARVRTHMSRQLTRHRLAAAFPSPCRVAAKSGGLFGVVRNEVGVLEQPDGQRFYVAVFTRSDPGADEAGVNAAIGQAAGTAVASLTR
jgi:beta-lactamase class A